MKNNLEFMMKSNNVSPSKLSKDTGVSRSTIYRILDGGTPSAVVMTKLSRYFNRPLGDLFCA
ncbi:helix-turn-helix transcriptional regulator [Paenibacillus sp. CAU 1782]